MRWLDILHRPSTGTYAERWILDLKSRWRLPLCQAIQGSTGRTFGLA